VECLQARLYCATTNNSPHEPLHKFLLPLNESTKKAHETSLTVVCHLPTEEQAQNVNTYATSNTAKVFTSEWATEATVT
jgi:hypothetical protein